MEQQYTLRDIRTGRSYPVSPQGTRIGREPPNDIVLPDESISHRHATVWVETGRLYIRDEGSTNGTWVNERRITGPTPLRPGDRVRMGYTVLEVTATGPAMTVAIPASAIPAPAIPARRWPSTSRLWWLAGLGALILCGLLALVGGLWVLGRQEGIGGLLPFLRPTPTPTFTPTPTPTLTPTPTCTPTTTPTPTRTPTRTPTPTPYPTDTPTPTPCLPDVAFVTDVTVPDGTQFRPGASFTKTWRVRSSGCALWPQGTRWVFVSGDRMGAPAAVDVPIVALGATADIAVPMTAPTTPGTYKGYWQMRDPNGRFFGDRVYVMIVVAQPTPTPDTRPTVAITIINDTGGTITLSLSGPATYRFTLEPGRHTIRVIPGDYSYTVWGCGGASKSGTYNLSEGDEWRFWCQ